MASSAPPSGFSRNGRELAVFVALAVACSVAMLWIHSWNVTTSDYAAEARIPLTALLHGHLWQFLQTAPVYGGSLELRAPFALIASLAGGSARLVFRFSALPCLLASGALGVWIAGRLRVAGHGWLTALAVLAICVANPITYYMLQFGHAEELLGGVLCALAVLAAIRGNTIWAGILLGVAIGNKEWALVAVGPVIVGLPAHRWRALLIAAGVALAMLGPIAIASSSLASGGDRLIINDSGTTFYPQQLWWFFAPAGHWVPSMAGQIPREFRVPPLWLQGRAHDLIVWIGLPLTWLAARRRMPRENALLLLALLLVLRCALDPWDLGYYMLPFIIALLTWETTVKLRKPLGALAATAATWLVFEELPYHLTENQQALSFTIPAVVTIVAIGVLVYRPGRSAEQSTQPILSRPPGALS